MTPEDRDLLHSLRLQQAELQKSLERLNVQLGELEARAHPVPELPDFPPIPVEPVDTIFFPPVPSHSHLPEFPPLPVDHALPPPPAPFDAPDRRSTPVDWHIGRWLMRASLVIFFLGFIAATTWFHFYENLGNTGKLALLGVISMVLVLMAQRSERRKNSSRFFTRCLMFAGLAMLYGTLYTAGYANLHRFAGPLVGGVLLIFWSIYVFYLAERRNSELLGLFSIVFAYIGTAANPDPLFTFSANIVLAAMSVVFLLRMGWAALPAFAVIGTYFAVFRRLIVDDDGTVVLDTSRTLPFWPFAFYLYLAWLIFTAAVIFCDVPSFRGGKRILYLTLNNFGLAFLLALTAYLAGYGAASIGNTLLDTGIVFLIASRVVGMAAVEPVAVMSAYATQGLILVTSGIVIVFTGITRAVVLLVETFLFGVAGAFAGDRVLTIATYIAAFFATFFSIWEIAVYAHHPWLLGIGGAIIMLMNAWNCRGEVRASKVERSSLVFSTFCYCVFAVALVFAALSSSLNDSTLPPALAIAAIVLTFLIYQFSIFELPALAQFLLIAALAMVLFPAETGEDLPWWSLGVVALVTLLLVTYWSRQRFLLTGGWRTPILFIYALALVDFTVQAVRPWCGAESWMITSAFLSFGFLIYGAFTRTWAVAAAGQIFLFLSLYHFFWPPSHSVYAWSLLAASIPVIVTYATARAALQWLTLFTDIRGVWREGLLQAARWYLVIATFGIARWIFGILPESAHVPALLLFGTLILSSSVRHYNIFGIRCSFFLSALGMGLYFCSVDHWTQTLFCAFSIFLLLVQPALLRNEGKPLVTPFESWALVLSTVATGWLFVSAWASYHPVMGGEQVYGPLFTGRYIILAWTLYAFALFLFGYIVRERRLSKCAVLILLFTILRVFVYDFWGFSGGFRVISLFVLAFAALIVGFVLVRRGRHPKSS